MRRVLEATAIVAGGLGLLAGCAAQLPNGTVTSVHCEPRETATGNCPDPIPPKGSWRICVKADKVSDIEPAIDAGNGVACGKGWIGEGSDTNNVNAPAAWNCQVGDHYPECEDPRRK